MRLLARVDSLVTLGGPALVEPLLANGAPVRLLAAMDPLVPGGRPALAKPHRAMLAAKRPFSGVRDFVAYAELRRQEELGAERALVRPPGGVDPGMTGRALCADKGLGTDFAAVGSSLAMRALLVRDSSPALGEPLLADVAREPEEVEFAQRTPSAATN